MQSQKGNKKIKRKEKNIKRFAQALKWPVLGFQPMILKVSVVCSDVVLRDQVGSIWQPEFLS
jgi:hypothetical protein